jgi:hypothetical protein
MRLLLLFSASRRPFQRCVEEDSFPVGCRHGPALSERPSTTADSADRRDIPLPAIILGVLMFLAVVVICAFPSIATKLPDVLMALAASAPPCV